jgi:hypothetical protein
MELQTCFLTEQELAHVFGGVDVFYDTRDHLTTPREKVMSFIKHPVTQSFAAGIIAGLAIKGLQYSIHQ